MSRRGLDIKPTGEVAETLEKEEGLSRWKSVGLLVLSLAAIIGGSEMLVTGSKTIINRLGLVALYLAFVIGGYWGLPD